MSVPRLGAIAVVPHEGRLLLVKRAKAPNALTWGFPGGHVEMGETGLAAAVRELHEETGVIASPVRYLTNIDAISYTRDGAVEYHYLLTAVLCSYVSGTPVAADDAADVGWFTPQAAAKLRQSPNLQTVIDLLDF